jgi:NifU-like protein involved in Fe-S cluster formation
MATAAAQATAIAGETTAIAGEATAIQDDVTKNHAARQEENAKIFSYRRDFPQVVDCAQVTEAADGPDAAIVRGAGTWSNRV